MYSTVQYITDTQTYMLWVCADCKIRPLSVMIMNHFGSLTVCPVNKLAIFILITFRCFLHMPAQCGGVVNHTLPPTEPNCQEGDIECPGVANLSIVIRCCVSAVVPILSSPCCCSLCPRMHSLFFHSDSWFHTWSYAESSDVGLQDVSSRDPYRGKKRKGTERDISQGFLISVTVY